MARGFAYADGASREVDEASRLVMHHATDRSISVLSALLSNPSLGPGLLEALLFHKRPEVRRAAADRLDSRGPHLVAVREDASVPEIRDVAVNSSVTSVLPSPVIAPTPIRGFRIPPD
jgi:hypothetical protein